MAGALIIISSVEMGVPVAGHKVGTVIRSENNYRILIQSLFLQLSHQLSKVLVQTGALPQIVRILFGGITPQSLQISRKDKVREAFPGAPGTLIVLMVVLVMRLNLGNSHKKRPVSIITVQKLQRKIINAVGPVALKINALIILIKHIAVIAMRGKLQHIGCTPESGVASPKIPWNGGDCMVSCGRSIYFPVTGQMPLADISGFIAGIFHIAGQRPDI